QIQNGYAAIFNAGRAIAAYWESDTNEYRQAGADSTMIGTVGVHNPSANTITFTRPNKYKYRYGQPDSQGFLRWLWVEDPSGNRLTMTYSGDQLTRVDTPSSDGRYLAFTYGTNTMTVTLKDSSNNTLRTLEYEEPNGGNGYAW